jgi:glycoprotein 6-alpha-L-fucosyltransferase
MAYEIMQQRYPDGAWRAQSLDDVYYFTGEKMHNQRAVIGHQIIWPNEFNFQPGDIIETAGNHWDGFSKGSNKNNGQSGLYPSYKVEEIVNIAEMHTYPEVNITED